MSAPVWTMARRRREGCEGLPDTFQVYAILKDGAEVGEVRYNRSRWKNAGGPAWQGTLYNGGPIAGIHSCYHNRNRLAVLQWFKTGVPT